MEKKAINIAGSKLYGPYTPGVMANGMIWLSGQIDVEAGNDVKSQTAGALKKIDALLDAAGVRKNSICFAQVLLDDIKEIADAKTKARGQQLQALGQALQSAGTAPTYNNSMSPISNTSNLTYTLSEEYVQGTQKICVYQRLGKLKFVTHNNKFTICSMSKRYSD